MINNGSKKKVIAKIYGGLGNQLFQYATGRRLAFITESELLLDITWFTRKKNGGTTRKYELGALPINARICSGYENIICRLTYSGLARRMGIKTPFELVLDNEKGVFSGSVLNMESGILLYGHWQSEKYFEDVADLIRSELQDFSCFDNRDKDVVNKIKNTNSVAIHVRRGDYVTSPDAAATHGICPLSYYAKAVKFISKKVNNPCYFIFSDDPDWAMNNLKTVGGEVFIMRNNLDNPIVDLNLMALCKHQIIANSSFSWWGAWLNTNPMKIVIAPKQWFLNDKIKSSDLIPDAWEKL